MVECYSLTQILRPTKTMLCQSHRVMEALKAEKAAQKIEYFKDH